MGIWGFGDESQDADHSEGILGHVGPATSKCNNECLFLEATRMPVAKDFMNSFVLVL